MITLWAFLFVHPPLSTITLSKFSEKLRLDPNHFFQKRIPVKKSSCYMADTHSLYLKPDSQTKCSFKATANGRMASWKWQKEFSIIVPHQTKQKKEKKILTITHQQECICGSLWIQQKSPSILLEQKKKKSKIGWIEGGKRISFILLVSTLPQGGRAQGQERISWPAHNFSNRWKWEHVSEGPVSLWEIQPTLSTAYSTEVCWTTGGWDVAGRAAPRVLRRHQRSTY